MKTFLFFLFISCYSFLAGQELLTATILTPGNAGNLSEECEGSYELIIRRGPDNTDTTIVFLSTSGDAVIGPDFNIGTFPLEMLPSDSVLTIVIDVEDDGLTEGTETLFFEIAFMAGDQDDVITLETSITDAYDVEIQTASDTIIWCRDVPYVLLATSVSEIYWTPSAFFDDASGPAATVRPVHSGWVYANVGNDLCGTKDSVYFNLAIAEILDPDTLFICLGGEGVTLHGNISGLATDFIWFPADTTLSNPEILTPVANPTVTTTYTLQTVIDECTSTDRVVVKVDSLPEDMHIDIAPLKPYYCAGEIVALFSPSYDSLHFPDITFSWAPPNALNTFLSPTDLLNAALNLFDTTLYIRTNINNACMSMDSILINVVPPSVPLSVPDTSLCPGESVTVSVLASGISDPEWSPATGLSCTECLTTTITVTGSPGDVLTYEFSGMILECPVGASITISIPEIRVIDITGGETVCEGETVALGIGNTEGLSGFQWSVNSGDASLSCTACDSTIVTINETENIEIFVTAINTNPDFCGAFGAITLASGVTQQFNGGTFNACLGDTVSVFIDRDDVSDLEWSVLSGNAILSCTACPSPVVTVVSEQGAVIRFFGETSLPGFCNVSGTVLVEPFGEDESNLIPEPNPIVTPVGQGSEVMVTLAASPSPANVIWTINGASVPASGTAINFNANEEINFITATFINSHGCEQTDTLSIPTVPPSFMIPNAFSPDNGDELNDNFRVIINGDIEIVEFLIFNRWGQLVYEAPENDLAGWDGRFKGEPAASDTYVYSARLRYPDGRTEIAKGDVVLLR